MRRTCSFRMLFVWTARLALFCIALSSPRHARAEADPEAAAEALFRSGREAAAAGDHGVACARFRESQRLQPAAGTLLNLAICEEHLRQLVEAFRASFSRRATARRSVPACGSVR